MNPTDPTPAPEPSLNDYAALRREGLRQLERLAGSQWTDFNAHDPGITILEQYCYALTELGYRCGFPLQDLLAQGGQDPYASLPGPARILSCRPVALDDFRKLALDVRGVRNAWIEAIGAPEPQAYFDAEDGPSLEPRRAGGIRLRPGPGAEALGLRGLYRVLLEKSKALDVPSAELVRAVATRLHAHRPLGMEFAAFEVMEEQKIQVRASLEIDPAADPERLYAAVLDALAATVSPPVPFQTLAGCRAQGLGIDQIMEGPPLAQGFVDATELAALERKTALRVSDFVRALMDVAGVRMVKHLALGDGGGWEDWWLKLEPGKTPGLDPAKLDIRLERGQIEVGFDRAAAIGRHSAAQAGLTYRPARPEDLDLIPPKGRDRRVDRYDSAQHQFPEIYGLGELGLPPEADTRRRAQLAQLQAYLLFFDQLLANQFAQLAHLRDLLGFDGDGTRTYFAADIDDPGLRLDGVWRLADRERRLEYLGLAVENPAAAPGFLLDSPAATPAPADPARRHRLLDHLLARYAERFADPGEFRRQWDGSDALAQAKRAWLRGYPDLSADRGTGHDLLAPWNPGQEPGSGLERRLRLKLGLDPTDPRQHCHVIEHLLLRPVAGDLGQRDWPLMADASAADPYSLQISAVFPGGPDGPWADPGFRRFTEQTLREEAPAHLTAYAVWLDPEEFMAFEDARGAWLDSQQQARSGLTGPDADAALRLGLRLRDARNRVADGLGLGRSYPLADLPVRYTDTVAWGQRGQITLLASQPGVLYQLLGPDGQPFSPDIQGQGDGGDLNLPTPIITDDLRFAVRASKTHTWTWAAVPEADGGVLVADSRLDTRYELLQADGQPFAPPIAADGKKPELRLTPPVGASGGFRVRAVKTLALRLFNPAAKPGEDGTLFPIGVGLDRSLAAGIVDADLLVGTAQGPRDARIVDYGGTVQVEVQASQAGVDYRLARLLPNPQGADDIVVDPATQAQLGLRFISGPNPVRGDSHTIALRTQAMQEDTDIRVFALKTFKPGDQQKTQKALLDAILPLKVRANPALAVATTPAWVDYGSGAAVALKATQTSASYQLLTRPLRDGEFVRDGGAAAFPIPGLVTPKIALPPNPTLDAVATGAALPGNGGDLVLPLAGLKEDTLVVVAALKTHTAQPGQPPVPSRLQLVQATAVLVRPGQDPVFPLRLVRKDGAAAAGLQKGTTYQVLNGQAGVFYYFRRADTQEVLGLPVYFHKAGKGVDQLQVEVDWALTGGPPPPEWDCPLDLDPATLLSIRAVKAQTGLDTVFTRGVATLLAGA